MHILGGELFFIFDPQADAKLYFDDSANIHAPIIKLTRVDVNGVSTVNSNLNARFEEIFPGFSSLTDDEKTLVQKASQSWNPDVDGDFVDYIVKNSELPTQQGTDCIGEVAKRISGHVDLSSFDVPTKYLNLLK